MTDSAAFARWAARVTGARAIELGVVLGGGNANVTRLVIADDRRYVLRHPPVQTISDKAAAGIRREYDLLVAISDVAPVPRPIAFCDDLTVLGAPFMLVEHIDGVAITNALPPGYADDAATVSRIGEELVDTLAAIHRVDWRTRMPGAFGRPEGFLQRQIARWRDVRRKDSVRDLPMIEELGAWLLARSPEDEPATIVHCDYHLDNALFAPSEPKLRAVIDWEMATLGPPLVDLGLFTMFWARDEHGPTGFRFVQRVSNRAGVISRRALAERWSAATGFSLANLAWFQCFAFWRLAAIVEGAYVLQVRGLVDSAYARSLADDVPALLAEAAAVAGQR